MLLLPLEQCVDVELTIPARGKAVMVRNQLLVKHKVPGAIGPTPSVLFELNEFAFRQGPAIKLGELGDALRPGDVVRLVVGPTPRLTIDVRRDGLLLLFRGAPRSLKLDENRRDSGIYFTPPTEDHDTGWMTLNFEIGPPARVGGIPIEEGRHTFQVITCTAEGTPGRECDVVIAFNEAPLWHRVAAELPYLSTPFR